MVEFLIALTNTVILISSLGPEGYYFACFISVVGFKWLCLGSSILQSTTAALFRTTAVHVRDRGDHFSTLSYSTRLRANDRTIPPARI